MAEMPQCCGGVPGLQFGPAQRLVQAAQFPRNLLVAEGVFGLQLSQALAHALGSGARARRVAIEVGQLYPRDVCGCAPKGSLERGLRQATHDGLEAAMTVGEKSLRRRRLAEFGGEHGGRQEAPGKLLGDLGRSCRKGLELPQVQKPAPSSRPFRARSACTWAT
jgi:hypothetical protein